MLAAAARQAGFCPLVIDRYGDQDTRAISKAVVRVDALNEQNLSVALDSLMRCFRISFAVYGSGLEGSPGCVQILEHAFELLGNDYATFLKVQNKRLFFERLARFKIPYPSVLLARPKNLTGWLLKPFQGEGGVGIRRFDGQSMNENAVYWQKAIDGIAGSALFLTDGCRPWVIGYNTQWCAGIRPDSEFIFSGIINESPLSFEQEQRVERWIHELVDAYSLKGLNTLDFIVQDDRVLVLEINPRPSASLQLYGGDLLSMHIDACYGRLSKSIVPIPGFCGLQIVFAQSTVQIPEHFQWPEGCTDLPASGLIIRKGEPICSIIARDESRQRVQQALATAQQIIVNQIREGHYPMEYSASVNQLAQPLVKELVGNADKLRVGVEKLENGCTIIDAGIKVPGGLEAGRIIAEICLGGMGTVTLTHSPYTSNWPLTVNVHTGNPVLGCLGSQYAGWSLSHDKYYALGSGPARARATKLKDGQQEPVEELYKELGYRDEAEATVLVIENDALPPIEIVEKVAKACQVDPANLTLIVTPTSSLAGGVQVVARVLEVAMHKAHALHFPLENIIDGSGSAPLCPPHPDFIKAMGRTNDAILFAGQVHIFVKGSDAAAEKLAKALPSSTSKDYGKPFAEVFKEYKYDFFKVDPMLFSPASVIVTAVESGRSFRAGQLDNALLDQSFGA